MKKLPKGRIVELFTSGSIGETDADVLDKVRSNTLQIGNTTPNCFADLSGMSEYYVYGIPYLMSTDEELNGCRGEVVYGMNKTLPSSRRKVFDSGVNIGWFGFLPQVRKYIRLPT